MQNPFSSLDISETEKYTLIDVFNNYLRFPPRLSKNFNIVLERVEKTFDEAYSYHRFPDDVVTQVKTDIVKMKNLMMQIIAARKVIHNPCPTIYNREDPDHPRHMALSVIQTILVANEVVIVDNETMSSVGFAVPIRGKDGHNTYTYTESMSLHNVLRILEVDQVVAEKYVLHKTFINETLSINNSNSDIPLIPNTFVDDMRYISWKNGLLCCRTSIFYYHREHLPEEMPDNWKHFSDSLPRINNGKIRAIKFINKSCDYYQVLVTMLRGVYNRKNPQVQEFYDSNENECADYTHGNDTLNEGDEEAQADFVRDKLEHFDEWIHDPNFLAELEPLDVQLSSIQKIYQDQSLPRGAYRIWLETCGRCTAGVIGKSSRSTSGAHKVIEESLGKEIEDRLEYATVIEGTAGTGKSTLLNFLQELFDPNLIGVVSDTCRPIDPYSTVRGKAVVVSSDMQNDEKVPVPTGDLKKMISNESLVNHRLHKDSKIVHINQHVLFIMNAPLPYADTKGDIERRFAQTKMRKQVGKHNQYFSTSDQRTLTEVFYSEDLNRFPVVASFAHKRRLLNVGNRAFYRAAHPKFMVPKYILGTQAEYCRMQNSFRGFILGLECDRHVSFDNKYAEYSVDRSIVHEEYKNYCEEYKCPLKDSTFIDRYMTSTFGCSISGNPMRYFGIKYKDCSMAPGENGDDEENQDNGCDIEEFNFE